jgi:hypothetical protein
MCETGRQHMQGARSCPLSCLLVVIAEIRSASLASKRPREVETEGIGGPMVPRIPLYLAKITARVLLTVRGMNRTPSSSIVGCGTRDNMEGRGCSTSIRVRSTFYS